MSEKEYNDILLKLMIEKREIISRNKITNDKVKLDLSKNRRKLLKNLRIIKK